MEGHDVGEAVLGALFERDDGVFRLKLDGDAVSRQRRDRVFEADSELPDHAPGGLASPGFRSG